jgi:hypothetical protein
VKISLLLSKEARLKGAVEVKLELARLAVAVVRLEEKKALEGLLATEGAPPVALDPFISDIATCRADRRISLKRDLRVVK